LSVAFVVIHDEFASRRHLDDLWHIPTHLVSNSTSETNGQTPGIEFGVHFSLKCDIWWQ